MVKIGIIGVGRISATHIAGIKKYGNSVITAICDIDEDKLNSVGDSLNIPKELKRRMHSLRFRMTTATMRSFRCTRKTKTLPRSSQ